MPSLMPDQPISGFNAFFASLSAKTRGVKARAWNLNQAANGQARRPRKPASSRWRNTPPFPTKKRRESRASGEQLKPSDAPSVSQDGWVRRWFSGESPTASKPQGSDGRDRDVNATTLKPPSLPAKAQQDANPATVVDTNHRGKGRKPREVWHLPMGGGTKAMSNNAAPGLPRLSPRQFAAHKARCYPG